MHVRAAWKAKEVGGPASSVKLSSNEGPPKVRTESARSRNAGGPSSCSTAVELVDEEESWCDVGRALSWDDIK